MSPAFLNGNWVSVHYIAHHYHRSIRHVQRWCANGTLIDFGFKIAQDLRGRYWILLPDDSI